MHEDRFELIDIFKPLEADLSLIMKRMFGGLAVYYNGLMVTALMEDPGETSYRGKKYDYAIWYGLLICTSREHQASLIKSFPDLSSHPVLGKWLYLPFIDEADFRTTAKKIMNLIVKGDRRIGIVPKQRKKSKKGPQRKK